MDEDQASVDQTAARGGTQTIQLFLALFLLVLAFFIVLVTISTVEDVRSRAVMDSLSSVFTPILPPSTDPTQFTSKDGDVVAAEAFQEAITGIFTTSIQVAKVEIVQPGRLMRVTVPADALFVEDAAEVRPARFPFLDRIVASLSGAPAGLHFDMEFLVGSPYAAGRRLSVEQTRELARAGAFARTMVSRGVPPDSLSIGIRAGDPGVVEMRFFVRPKDEARLSFERAADDAGGP